MAGRLRRTVVAVTLVVLLLPMAAATSLADTGPAPTEVFKFSSNGYSVSADEGQCTAEGDIVVSRTDGTTAVLSRPGVPDSRVALPRRELAELLAEELRRLDPDEVYGEVLAQVGAP